MKKPLILFTVLVILLTSLDGSSAQAQTITVPFTFSGASPVALQMDQYGNLSSLGTFGTGSFPITGAGTRMFWAPGQAAIRAGYVSGSDWDSSNIGRYSTAFGRDPMATGEDSVAIGQGVTATNNGAVALGDYAGASGYSSVAMGNWAAALGNTSFSLGQNTWAQGDYSLATGYQTGAYGSCSAAFGSDAEAVSYDEFVLGTYNIGGGASWTQWVSTDPLFEIGNGTSSSARSDALVVYKNGNAILQGTLQTAPGGDIPMYSGN